MIQAAVARLHGARVTEASALIALAKGASLEGRPAVAAALLTVVTPWAVVVTSFLMEPLAYPAFVWSLWAIWRACLRPSPRADLLALLLILGIDTFLDMGRSATNVVGNSVAAAVVAKLDAPLPYDMPHNVIALGARYSIEELVEPLHAIAVWYANGHSMLSTIRDGLVKRKLKAPETARANGAWPSGVGSMPRNR